MEQANKISAYAFTKYTTCMIITSLCTLEIINNFIIFVKKDQIKIGKRPSEKLLQMER
jgi:hypothetical protein